MAQVSQAERYVNGVCGQTFTAGAAPGGVVSATLEMARYYMNIQMLTDGHIKEFEIRLSFILKLCEEYLKPHHVTIDYASSSQDFDLRRLRDY